MNQFISVIYFSYLQTISSLRIKQALFYTVFFPVLLFVIFGYIWGTGDNVKYVPFLFTGIVGMAITSDGFFAVGPIISIYRDNNILKFLKNLPQNILLHFIGYFLSRIIVLIFDLVILCVVSYLLFNYLPSLQEFFRFVIAVFLGEMIFSLISLLATYFSKGDGGRGLLSFLYTIMLFLSGTFFPINHLGKFMTYISNILPLTHLLNFLRGKDSYLFILLGWIIIFMFLFYIMITKVSNKR